MAIVARSGKTRRDTLKEIVNALNSLDANILGTILDHHQGNDLPSSAKQKGTAHFTERPEHQARSVVSA
ncbi:MAG: hypothetical protein R3E79_29445 [Caldilineaceae bacterium]